MTSKISLLLLASAFFSIAAFSQRVRKNSYKPGQTFNDCKDCPEMVVITSGSFMMGAKDNEPGSFPEEKPQRRVNIRQFACGKFDITKKEWAAFAKATNRPTTGGCSGPAFPGDTSNVTDLKPSVSWNHVGFGQDSSHPVICVTWQDAKDYTEWLSKKTGFNYRLLTEAEWEYAARAGTTTTYPWGDTASHEYANYGMDSGFYKGRALGRDKWDYSTSPVGAFPPNAFNLYDMNGNVMQWVEDCFSPTYIGLPTDGSAYTKDVVLKLSGDLAAMNGLHSTAFHLCRGGGFGDPRGFIRSAFRNWAPAPGATLQNYRSSGLGFRVARTIQ